MTEEVAPAASAAPKSEDQLMDSPDTATDGNSLPPDLLKRKEKPIPNYLRASTRSCHDNCKFGTHHSPESKKPWHVVRRPPQLRRASTGSQGIDRVEIMLPKGARPRKDQMIKISLVKDGNSPAPAPAKPEPTGSKAAQDPVSVQSESICCVRGDLPAEDASEPGNLPTDAECFVVSHGDEASDRAESIELEMPLAIQDSDVSDENMEYGFLLASNNAFEDGGAKSLVDPGSDRSANNHASATSEVRNALAVMKHKLAGPGNESKSSADKPVKLKEKAAVSVTGNTASVQKSRRTTLPEAAIGDSEITTEPKPVRARASVGAATARTTKMISRQRKTGPTVTSAVPKVKEIKVPSSPSNATDSSAKPARLTKPKASTVKSALSPSISSEKQADRKMTLRNVARNARDVQKQRDEKVKQRSLKLSRSMNLSAKSISSVKVRAVKKEKTAPPITSSKKVSGITDGSAADAKDANDRSLKPASLKVRKADSVKGKESQTHKEKTDTPAPRTRTLTRISKPTPIPSSTATPPPRKLTFRRGKVLNPDGGGTSSTPTRRLRFRPAAAAAADASVVRSRGGRVTGRNSAARAGTSPAEVVVLRRRQGGVSVDEKKKKQAVLLNNVIEETASRLVSEARKSKVKALVGAFETVISLQEGGKAAGPPAAAAAAAVAQ